MKRKTALVMLLAVSMLSMTIVPKFVSTTVAQQTPSVYVESATAQVGEAFNVSVMVSDVQDLWAWQAGIVWDPNILEFVGSAWGDFSAGTGQQTVRLNATLDSQVGQSTVPFLESALDGSTAVTASSLRLLTITFQGIKAGSSSISLLNVSLVGRDPNSTTAYVPWSDVDGNGVVDIKDVLTVAIHWIRGSYNASTDVNSDGAVNITDIAIVSSDFGKMIGGPSWGVSATMFSIAANVENGTATIEGQTPSVYVESATAQVGEAFNVSIMVSDVQDLWAWQAGIVWDPNILEFVGSAWGDFRANAGFPQTVQFNATVDSQGGQTTVPFLESAMDGSTAVTTSSLRLLTITFQGIKAGFSSIGLVNVSLVGRDPNSTTAYVPWSDVDGDGRVDIKDVIIVAYHWINGSYNASTDVNSDGAVNITDIAIVSSDFGKMIGGPSWGVSATMFSIAANVENGTVTIEGGTNLYLSMNAPASIDHGTVMDCILYYEDFGAAASDVVLQATLSTDADFLSASDGGTYDSLTRTVTWSIGAVPGFPTGQGSETVSVMIPSSIPINTVIQTDASISSSTPETRYDDNTASAQTIVSGLNLPPNTGVSPVVGNGGGTPSVNWVTPTTFSYYDPTATGVDISIHLDDGGADITGSMTGGPTWTFTTTFYPRHGNAIVTYTVYGPSPQSINFNIYVDPAGYVYDTSTLERIAGATVWLQQPNWQGGWENVPTGQTPPIMQPDVNPQITGTDGQYQWDVLNGVYRVHVEAPGYYSADSIAVTVPPPVADLNVGLIPIGLHDVNVTSVAAIRARVYQGYTGNINVTVLNEGDFPENVIVTLYYNLTANKIIGSQAANLSPKQNQTIVFVWNTTGVAYGNYTISAYAGPVPGETNTADNILIGGQVIVSLVGDVTGPGSIPDGQVNLMDVYRVAMEFGSSAPTWDPYWGPLCDINNDGTINLIDYYKVCMNFGQAYP